MANPPVITYPPICQYEILSQPVAPVAGVPYVEQGFFVQLYNLSEKVAVPLTVYYVSNLPIADLAAKDVLKFGANYILNDGIPVQQTLFKQGNARYFPAQTLQPRNCIIFGIQYYLDPTKSSEKLGDTPMENASSRGMVQLGFFQNGYQGNIYVCPTIRQVFTSYDAAGNPTDVSSSAYSVPAFGAYPLNA